MPAISLVVCVRNQADLLERLLGKTADCYDQLVIVHDGPDSSGIREICARFNGSWFEPPALGSLEEQSPFAWSRSSNDWILRLDADEFPSDEMKRWLEKFRRLSHLDQNRSGYQCIWPLWNGSRAVSRKWPNNRIFLFDRQRVRFFGLIEQVPIPDTSYEKLDLVLHHQPERKSYGLHNILVRPQAYRWRERIAKSLLGKPTDLPCWRWKDDSWPEHWEQIRRSPLRTALSRLILETLRSLRDQWRRDQRFYPAAAVSGPIHHALICVAYLRRRRAQRKQLVSRPNAHT
jgi:hypothetical protein